MADNVSVSSAATVAVATRKITYSGDADQNAQAVIPIIATGSDDSKTGTDIIPVSAGLDSTGAGVQAVGPLLQFDDTSPAAVTENQYASPRISSRRAQLIEGVASGTAVRVDNGGTFATQVDGAALTALQLIDDSIVQDDAGVTAGTTKVTMAGAMSVAHGSNPDAADAGDGGMILANRHRVPFFIGGHPNVISREYMTTGSQTNDAVILVSSGAKIVVTQIQVIVSNATTVNVQCRVGFGTASVPSEPASGTDEGVAGVVFSHPGIAPGSGATRGDGSGMLGVGADAEDLRITCDAPTSGKLTLLVSYFTIES